MTSTLDKARCDKAVLMDGDDQRVRGVVEVTDKVNHPHHYTKHPSGIECIQITEHMGFNLGNVIKYVWRADLKGETLEDLNKARWYLDREIARRSK